MNTAQQHRHVPAAAASTPGWDEQSEQTARGQAQVIRLPRRQGTIEQPSPRELQVLDLTAEGLTNAEIGKNLFLTEETVKSHLRNLLAKLQARSRAHAVAIGFRQRLIT